jgi:hypothetical protein
MNESKDANEVKGSKVARNACVCPFCAYNIEREKCANLTITQVAIVTVTLFLPNDNCWTKPTVMNKSKTRKPTSSQKVTEMRNRKEGCTLSMEPAKVGM